MPWLLVMAAVSAACVLGCIDIGGVREGADQMAEAAAVMRIYTWLTPDLHLTYA
jgi:hypothetical protein